MERFPSGQREQTVNLSALAFEGSNPSLSTIMIGNYCLIGCLKTIIFVLPID